jgi:UDP-glucuronate decarboxylase
MLGIDVEDTRRTLSADLPWERLAGKTVIVTGAAGMMAGYLVETCLAANGRLSAPCTVVGTVRNLDAARERFAHHRDNPLLRLMAHDVTRPLEIEGPADFIFHAASQASARYFATDPVGTLLANTLGTQHMLDLARRKASEGLLFFSSGEVYGPPLKPGPRTEDDYGPLDPASVRSCYGESKRLAETMCVAWSHQYGVPTFIVRISHTYGPGLRLDDGRVFCDFVADIVNRRDIVIKGDGLARRPFLYLADATEGYLLFKGRTAVPYNLANEDAQASIRELADILVGAFPERHLKVIMASERQLPVPSDRPVNQAWPDTSRLRALGWTPRTGIAEGFRRTVLSVEEALGGA